jgi:tRNA(adenine34) deaminase
MNHTHRRRDFVAGLTAVAAGVSAAPALAAPDRADVSPAEMERHKKNMMLAIEQAKLNPGRPFGSVIVDNRTNTVSGKGIVNMAVNPMYHSEVQAMNDYISKNGNKDWEHQTMYGTGEPCPMCMSAMIWAGLPSIVYASETPFVAKYVVNINLRAKDVIAAAPGLYKSKLLLGGVLSEVTDKMFEDREKALKAK